MKKFCIDAGHGMSNAINGRYDPGATATVKDVEFTEAAIVLEWAITGKWKLEQAGIPVYMIRDDDKDSAPVDSRDNRARAQGCTHMLSLHTNAAAPQAMGTETFYRDELDRSFAQLVQASALEAMQTRDRGLKTEDQSPRKRLAVMEFQGANALLEIGFISNPINRARMLKRDVRIVFWAGLIRRLKA